MAIQSDSVAAAMRAVRLQHATSIIVGLSIIVVPIVAALTLRRVADGRRRASRLGIWASGGLAMLLYVSVAFVFAVCWGGEIGESGKNRLARALGAPVVDAIERYHAATGFYPDSLTRLVPTYLDASALRAPEQSPLRYPFEYRRDHGYELTVRYGGPGMNTCRHTAQTGWRCAGYF